MEDFQDICMGGAEILEILALIVSERKTISDVELQQEIDRVMQAIKFT